MAWRGFSLLALLLCCWTSVGADRVPAEASVVDPSLSLYNLTNILVIVIEPEEEVRVIEKQRVDIEVRWYLNVSGGPDLNDTTCPALLTIETEQDWILAVANGTSEVDLASDEWWNVTLHGLSLGYAYFNVYAEWLNPAEPCSEVTVSTATATATTQEDDDFTSAFTSAETTIYEGQLVPLKKEDFDPFADFDDENVFTTSKPTTLKPTTPKPTTPKATISKKTKRPQKVQKPFSPSPLMVEVSPALNIEQKGGSLQAAAGNGSSNVTRDTRIDEVEFIPESASHLQTEHVSDKIDSAVAPNTQPRDVLPDYRKNDGGGGASLQIPDNWPVVAPVPKAGVLVPSKVTTEVAGKSEEAPPFEHIYNEGASYQSFRRRRRSLDVLETVAVAETVAALNDVGVNRFAIPLEYRVGVLRDTGVMDVIFIATISVVVAVNTLMMGCQLDLAVVKQVLKKPIGPMVGFVSQFMFMPLASYGLGLLFFTDVNLQLGLFALGCSPGGNGSNFWTLLLNGDINLSITMTFISTICAIFMMPFWMYTLGQNILDRGKIAIPFGNLIMSLLMFTVPLSIGVVIRHFKPAWAELAKKCIRPFSVILLVCMPILAVVNSRFLFALMTWQTLVAGVCIAWGGYMFGAGLAWICRMKRPQIIAVSIETAIQNAGVAFMVLMLTLGQPDADLSSVSPVSQLMVTAIPLFAIYIPIMIRRRCKQCKEPSKEEADKEAARQMDDIDSIDPLLINRQNTLGRNAVPPLPGAYDDKKPTIGVSDNTLASTGNGNPPSYALVSNQEPVYANMYMEYNDTVLDKIYDKPTLTMKQSLDNQPIREPEHEFENFRKGRTTSQQAPNIDQHSFEQTSNIDLP